MKKHLWLIEKIAVTATAIMLAFMLTATIIAVEHKGAVSSFFGSKTFEMIQTGDSKPEDMEYYKSKYKNLDELNAAAQAVGQEMEAEGATLIKNVGNALPLAKTSKISMFGIATADPAYGGRGSAQSGNPGKMTTLKEGMEEAGFSVNAKLFDFYALDATFPTAQPRPPAPPVPKLSLYKNTRAELRDAPWTDIVAADGVAASFSGFGDSAIFMVSRTTGEGGDLRETDHVGATDGDPLKLSIREDQVLRQLKLLKDNGTFKKIVVLMNSASQIECAFLDDAAYGVDAALWIGTPGQNGFSAVGKILAGTVNPSGRLSDMFWKNHDANPVMTNYGNYRYSNTENFDMPKQGANLSHQFNSYVVYQEGIYVGYRYAETRYEDVVMKSAKTGTFNYSDVVSYPFGYGQSYTAFEYSNFKAVKKGRTYTVSLDVRNTGTIHSGKEVVQIYVQKPYTEYDRINGVEKSAVDLVGYAKTAILAPKAMQTVSINVDEREFTSYDANKAKTYILEEGNYYLAAGYNAHDALNNILAAKGYKTSDGMDAAGNATLAKSFKLNSSKDYSISDATNKTITNLFDQADVNKYAGGGDNKVLYVSRNDWAGTVKLNRTESVKLAMTKYLFDELMGQIDISTIKVDNIKLPTYGADNGLTLMNLRVDSEGNKIEYDNPAWEKILDQLSWEDTVKLCSTGFRKTAGISSIAKPETLDHNGPNGLVQAYASNPFGLAARTGIDLKDPRRPVAYPCTGILSSSFSSEMARKYGDILGEEAIWAGYAGFYGIGLNTHRTAYEGRAFEYYSEDPMLGGSIAAQEILGLQSKGCNAYIKHFALNEQETNRQGLAVWANEQSLREIYLKQYERAISEGDARAVMTSFTRIGAQHCPSSRALMTDYLRGECGFLGFAVTDMYSQYNSVKMPLLTLAGCDIPDGDLIGASTWDKDPFSSFTEGKNIKANYGELAQAMRQSAKRILYSTVHSNAMNGMDVNTKIKMITPDWLVLAIITNVMLAVFLVAGVTCMTVGVVLKKKKSAK